MNQNYYRKSREWYSLSEEEVLGVLEVASSEGLNDEEALERLRKYGKNLLPEKKKESGVVRFFKHFNDILIYILILAAVVTAFLQHYADTVVILLVAVVNAAIGYFQENKAERALDQIKNMLSLKADVLRNGKRKEIEAEDLVVGDIVLLKPGDKVPADVRLIKADNLKIEESPLTGESVPSEKRLNVLDAGTELGDRCNMAFSSTTVSAGTGVGVVVATGKQTEIGKINQMLSDVHQMATPLLRQTAHFGKVVSIVIIGISIVIFAFGHFFRHYETGELLMSVIGLAVAAIPEGLPAILSIILAIGVQNMAKRNAIVRNLPSVETLGSVSVICSDKTGTLTKNEMTVQSLIVSGKTFEVTGTGYAPQGEIRDGNNVVDFEKEPVLKKLLQCFRICNDASLGKDREKYWSIKGDPTEGALVTVYEKSRLGKDFPVRIATLPFDSEYKYMATLIELDGKKIAYVKGAPDRLLEMSDRQLSESGEVSLDRGAWEASIAQAAGLGQRILGAGYKVLGDDRNEVGHEDMERGVVLLGIAGIIDPPREEAIDAVRECARAGITVKMITGDYADTAKAIGREMGIGDGTKALQGREIEVMDDKALEVAAMEYDIFARTSPEHKLRLVKALQKRGKICAMTGDGVNDAPALKKADVGIAMGIKGTEVTKDASEMVLADDNFRTIVSAVKEGRRVYDNLKKTILFILPTNGAESFLIIASILFGTMMPLTPIQILWVNMVTSVTVSLALAFEPAENNVMCRPPRAAKTPLLNRYFIWRILFVSVLIGGGTLLLNTILQGQGVTEEKVRTITLQTIVVAQLFHLFNSRSIQDSAFKKGFFTNKAVFVVSALLVILQLGITYLPFMNNVFETQQLALGDWVYPVILGVVVFVVVEIEKAVVKRIGIDVNG